MRTNAVTWPAYILIGIPSAIAVLLLVFGVRLLFTGEENRIVGAALITAAATSGLVAVTIHYARSTYDMARLISDQLKQARQEFEMRFSPQVLLWAGPPRLWSDHSQAIELDLQNIREGGADSITVSCEWAGRHYEATFTAMAARELRHVGVPPTDSPAKSDAGDGLVIRTSCTSAIQGLTGQPWLISLTRAQLQARGVDIDPKSVYEDRGLITL